MTCVSLCFRCERSFLPFVVPPRGGAHIPPIGLYSGAGSLQRRGGPPRRVQGLSTRDRWYIYPEGWPCRYSPLSTGQFERVWGYVVARYYSDVLERTKRDSASFATAKKRATEGATSTRGETAGDHTSKWHITTRRQLIDMTAKDSRKRPRVTRTPAKNHAQSPTFTSYQTPPSPLPGPAHFTQHSQSVSQFSHNLLAAQGGPSSVQSIGPSSPQNELMFFERAKRALEARDVYDDFLKLLNMFTRDIIDLKTLVVRAEKILADDMLFAQFKQLVNWDDRIGNVNYGPPGSIRTGPHDAALPRPVDDAQSPSYRRLPESVSLPGSFTHRFFFPGAIFSDSSM